MFVYYIKEFIFTENLKQSSVIELYKCRSLITYVWLYLQ